MKYKSEYNQEWQRKFAWFPVFVDGGQNKVFLEYYEERYVPNDNETDGCKRCRHWLGQFEARSISK